MIRFVKAHACGNDFLIVEGVEADADLAVRLCARNTGVGADGVEFLEWTGERSGRIRLLNTDGSVAEISGNGTRCVAAWIAYSKQLGPSDELTLRTDAGERVCRIIRSGGSRFEIASGMGLPAIEERTVTLGNERSINGAVVSTGNPHFVIFVEDESFTVGGLSWQQTGKAICFHPDFPQQTNVEFVRIVGPGEVQIRIFERGVGPTSSSGTGTCASAAAAIALRGTSNSLRVTAPGGTQQVDWAGGNSELTLTGPAELIAFGEAF